MDFVRDARLVGMGVLDMVSEDLVVPREIITSVRTCQKVQSTKFMKIPGIYSPERLSRRSVGDDDDDMMLLYKSVVVMVGSFHKYK